WRLTIQDNGPGIAAAERERVFERFYRILGSSAEGSGLGLAIAKEIVEGARGRISLADSPAPGGGLLVVVRLPAAEAEFRGRDSILTGYAEQSPWIPRLPPAAARHAPPAGKWGAGGRAASPGGMRRPARRSDRGHARGRSGEIPAGPGGLPRGAEMDADPRKLYGRMPGHQGL